MPELGDASTKGDILELLDGNALLEVLLAFKGGDFEARLPSTGTGLAGQIADALNDVIALSQLHSQELVRIGQVVGKEGHTEERIAVADARGAWAASSCAVNELIDDLLRLNREMARVIVAVAEGRLSETMQDRLGDNHLRGEFAETARTANDMLQQLSSFSSEVTRVAREVGVEGKLGGQANVSGASGVWRELTDNVNSMATRLTDQVRNIAEVTTAVAGGDLSKKVTADVDGEILELKDTINVMVDQLNSFAGEVTRVAREVGTEGRLGGQARVPGVAGTWKDLTDNVNHLAATLTTQIRAIAEVTAAVTEGDLNRSITVEASGEVAVLKDQINEMVRTIPTLLERAEESNRVKSQFLNMAAHELRTPLTVVMGYLSMMSDGTLGQPPPSWDHPLELLNLKAGELNKIVQDLLAAVRLAGGALPGNVAVCDLAQLALDAMGRARAYAELLGAETQVELPSEPVLVRADADELGRILDNLLNNALTYTIGQPWIRLTVRRTGPTAAVEVEDRGVGIPEHARELIFERFYRAYDSRLPAHPGTGLGLFLSRRMAERHNGSLSVARSEPGQGSTLTLALPLATSRD